MNDTRKRKRDDEQDVYYPAGNVQIVSNQNGAIDINQPLFLNPVIQNQQLVYQIPQVQGINSSNNVPENTYYVFIPVAESAEGQVVKEDGDIKAGQYVTYKPVNNDVKHENNSVITIDGIKKVFEAPQPKVPALPAPAATTRPHQVFIVDKNYTPNVQSPHPPSCQVNNSQIPNSAQNNSKWKNQLYRCEHLGCEEKFSSLHEKKIHLETHLFPESDNFKCGLCNLVFRKAVDRNKHVETHSIPNTYRCKHCEKLFPYYTTLTAHVEEAFTVDTFKCFYCDRQFDDTVTFLRHNSWSMNTCRKCGAKICGDMVYQKHINVCNQNVNVKSK